MDRVERKLSAIIVADVAGYSRLMGIDEEGTLTRLTAHRRDVIDPSIVRNRGRIVKSTGDGLLAELRASSTQCDAPLKCKPIWPNGTPARPRIGA